jgi:hypothetical protein
LARRSTECAPTTRIRRRWQQGRQKERPPI